MAQENQAEMSTDEQIGYHKGSLSTLMKERAELARILGIVEQLVQMHTAELKRLGINLDEQPEAKPLTKKDKQPIEDII